MNFVTIVEGLVISLVIVATGSSPTDVLKPLRKKNQCLKIQTQFTEVKLNIHILLFIYLWGVYSVEHI